MLNKPTAIELFCGAGGLSIGLKNAGFDIILANEIENDFAKTFELNHSNSKLICDDIHNIDFKAELSDLNIERVDLLSGGPPCQGFSSVGSKNEKDPRNSLFYEYLRAVSEINPNYVIFENVAGFSTMYNGMALKALINELGLLGYDCISSVLEASNFGLPQIRKRTIVIGWKKEVCKVQSPSPTHFTEEDISASQKKLTLMDAISDLPELKADDLSKKYKSAPKNNYQLNLKNGVKKLTEHNSSNYGPKMLEILSLIPEGGSVNNLPMRLRPKSYFGNTYARLLSNKPSPTITRNFGTPSSSRCVHPFQNRALSTREGARLQGFPDDYIFFGNKTSKNLQIGNAVPPILGEIIGNEILRSIKKSI